MISSHYIGCSVDLDLCIGVIESHEQVIQSLHCPAKQRENLGDNCVAQPCEEPKKNNNPEEFSRHIFSIRRIGEANDVCVPPEVILESQVESMLGNHCQHHQNVPSR